MPAASNTVRAEWKRTTLGEMFDIGSSKRVLKSQWKKSGVPFYRAREIVRLARDGVVDNDLFISEDHFQSLSNTVGVPQTGDLMVSAVGTLGACYEVKEGDRFYYKDASVLLFRPRVQLAPKFMEYAFLSDDLLSKVNSGQGATVGTFTITRARETEFLLPPPGEQKRIVSILDQAFAALDRARAHAEANLANADALFLQMASESLDQIVRASGTAPVGEVADHCLGKMLDKKKNKGALRPYLRNLNVRWFNVDTSDVLEMRIEDHEAERYEVRKGDLLICEGGYPGRAAIYDSDDTIYFQKALHRVRFTDPNLSKVLMYWLYVEDRLGRLKSHFSGTGISHFTGKALAAYQMPVAAENVTSVVASRIDRCWADTRKLVRAYEARLADITTLRQSLLQQAFSGQLT